MRIALHSLLFTGISSAFVGKQEHQDAADSPIAPRRAFDNTTFSGSRAHNEGPRPLHCIRSWLIYDSSTSAAVGSRAITMLQSSLETDAIPAMGTANVYTTIEGFPVARGTFTPQGSGFSITWKTATSTSWETITTGVWPISTPQCSRRNSSQRSEICEAYASEHGPRRSRKGLKWPPVWFDSVACPPATTSCTTPTGPSPSPGCTVEAVGAQLFYFPDLGIQTGHDGRYESVDVIHSFAPDVTFTSPTVYLSIEYLTAVSWECALDTICTYCSYGECTSTQSGNACSGRLIGTTESGPIISTSILLPTDEE